MRLRFLLISLSLISAVLSGFTRLEEKENGKFDAPSQSRLLESKIDVFINTLRTFVSPEIFAVENFARYSSSLASALTEIRKFHSRQGPGNSDAGEKLKFAKEKFGDMVAVSNWKLRSMGKGRPEENLMGAGAELSVLLLTLQDSSGKPYFRVNGYEGFLKKYKSIYAQLEDQAEAISESGSLTKWGIDLMLYNVKASILALEPRTGLRGY